MHCNLRPPEPVFSRFNYDHAKFEVAEHIHCRIIAFLLLILLYAVTFLTFDPVILTFDLEHLQCISLTS